MAPSTIAWIPESQAEKADVQEQLERILAHSAFKNSKRCAILLRYVVEQSLRGNREHYKERILGIEVFGRTPDYDTTLDPVVRTTAGEIRKRIAQFYHEPGHEAEIRIDLPPGSYAPDFHPQTAKSAIAVLPQAEPAGIVPKDGIRIPLRRRALIYVSVLAIVIVALWVVTVWPKPVLDRFWSPLFESSGPLVISIGQPVLASQTVLPTPDPNPTITQHIQDMDHVVLADAIALSRLSGLLAKSGKPFRLMGAAATTLTDLRQGPNVLISAFDNPWTMRALEPLRFHFIHGPDINFYWIEDSKSPDRKNYFVNFGMPYSKLTQDYAIVARLANPTTGQMTVIAAGIGENGTIAAAEFLTDPSYIGVLANQAPKSWASKNIEAVIATQVIDGKSGPPRVVAVEFW